MYHLPGTLFPSVDGRRPERQLLRLPVNLASEVLELDREAERVGKAIGEVLCAPRLVVERLGARGQELAGSRLSLVSPNPSRPHSGDTGAGKPLMATRPLDELGRRLVEWGTTQDGR